MNDTNNTNIDNDIINEESIDTTINTTGTDVNITDNNNTVVVDDTTESEPIIEYIETIVVDNSIVEWLESRDLFNTNINDFTITEILLSLILFVMLIKTFILRR